MRKKIIPILLILAGLLLLGVGLWPSLVQNQSVELSLPHSLAELALTDQVGGQQALDEVTYLHGKEFELASGLRGSYGSGGEAVIWVTGAGSEQAAGELVDRMTERIEEGNSPFRLVDKTEYQGRAVYLLEGMGQAHAYFQSFDLVIWLAADTAYAETALKQLLVFYP